MATGTSTPAKSAGWDGKWNQIEVDETHRNPAQARRSSITFHDTPEPTLVHRSHDQVLV